MFKSLTIAVGLILFSLCLVSAQTNYTDSTNPRSADRTVSPEARAESKRLFKEGEKYGLAGLYSQAVEIFQRALKLDPGNADAYYGLGHAYFDLRQYEKAVDRKSVV